MAFKSLDRDINDTTQGNGLLLQ